MKHILILLFLMVSISPISATPTPEINLTVSPNPIIIGDTFNYHIKLKAPESYSLVKIPTKKQLINTHSLEYRFQTVTKSIRENMRTIELNYSLQAFEPGEHAIPTQTITLKHKPTNRYVNIQLPTYPILVNTLKAEDDFSLQIAEKIYVETSLNWIPILIAILLSIGLIIVIIKGFSYWQTHRRKQEKPIIPEDPRTPLEKAVDALQENYSTIQTQDIRLYYVSYSEIIKTYLGSIFCFKCVEMTTTETLNACKDRLSPTSFQALKSLLENSDLIKFANLTSTEKNNEALLNNAIALLTEIYKNFQKEQEPLT